MNKTKLAVFCSLIIVLCTQMDVDAMNRGQGKRQGQGEKREGHHGEHKGGERHGRGQGHHGEHKAGEHKGRGGHGRAGRCKGGACPMRRGEASTAVDQKVN